MGRQKKPRRKFTKEFKLEAVKMLNEGVRPVPEICAALGVRSGLLYRWRVELQEAGAEAFRGQGNRMQLEEENRQLRLENQRLKLEQEILKKAAAYFAKHLG